jgi:flagellin
MQTEVTELTHRSTHHRDTKFNGVTLFGSGDVTLDIQTGSGDGRQGDADDQRPRRLGVERFDISTADGGDTALGDVDTALAAVATTRASLGAGRAASSRWSTT